MFFVQTSTLPPRMHQKITMEGFVSKITNSLPKVVHVELEDNSIVKGFHRCSTGLRRKGVGLHPFEVSSIKYFESKYSIVQ